MGSGVKAVRGRRPGDTLELYPMMMAVWKIAPTRRRQHRRVLKPSDTTPETTLLLAGSPVRFLSQHVQRPHRDPGHRSAFIRRAPAPLVAITSSGARWCRGGPMRLGSQAFASNSEQGTGHRPTCRPQTDRRGHRDRQPLQRQPLHGRHPRPRRRQVRRVRRGQLLTPRRNNARWTPDDTPMPSSAR